MAVLAFLGLALCDNFSSRVSRRTFQHCWNGVGGIKKRCLTSVFRRWKWEGEGGKLFQWTCNPSSYKLKKKGKFLPAKGVVDYMVISSVNLRHYDILDVSGLRDRLINSSSSLLWTETRERGEWGGQWSGRFRIITSSVLRRSLCALSVISIMALTWTGWYALAPFPSIFSRRSLLPFLLLSWRNCLAIWSIFLLSWHSPSVILTEVYCTHSSRGGRR